MVFSPVASGLVSFFARIFRRLRPALVVWEDSSRAQSSPSQAQLQALFEAADRVRVLEGGVSRGRALGKAVLFESAEPQDLRALGEALAIVEDPSTFGHCMCLGDEAVELYAGRRRLATLGMHHGRSIRWEAWAYDARLYDSESLLEWFSDRGMPGPHERFRADLERARAGRLAADRWLEAMPECLRPLWPHGHEGGAVLDREVVAATEQGYPDLQERARRLFSWFGRGAGPWSGYPSYENVAEKLLLRIPLEDLLQCAEDVSSGAFGDPHSLEGIARLFGSWSFRQRHPQGLRRLSPALRRRLLEHGQCSDNEDKRARAQAAFG